MVNNIIKYYCITYKKWHLPIVIKHLYAVLTILFAQFQWIWIKQRYFSTVGSLPNATQNIPKSTYYSIEHTLNVLELSLSTGLNKYLMDWQPLANVIGRENVTIYERICITWRSFRMALRNREACPERYPNPPFIVLNGQ